VRFGSISSRPLPRRTYATDVFPCKRLYAKDLTSMLESEAVRLKRNREMAIFRFHTTMAYGGSSATPSPGRGHPRRHSSPRMFIDAVRASTRCHPVRPAALTAYMDPSRLQGKTRTIWRRERLLSYIRPLPEHSDAHREKRGQTAFFHLYFSDLRCSRKKNVVCPCLSRPAPIAWAHPGIAGSLGDRCGASPRLHCPGLQPSSVAGISAGKPAPTAHGRPPRPRLTTGSRLQLVHFYCPKGVKTTAFRRFDLLSQYVSKNYAL